MPEAYCVCPAEFQCNIRMLNTMKLPTVNLIIPGLWALLRTLGAQDANALSRCNALSRLLRRSDRSVAGQMEPEHRVMEILGVANDGNTPVAALERLADESVDGQGWWLRADPVNLVADRQYIVMQHPDALGLDNDEAAQLVDLVNQHFAEDGWQLEMATPDRWYLRLSSPLDIETTPAWRVAGKDIDSYSPSGPDGLAWHASLNELQMLLYSSPVNDLRIAQGRPPVTGLWIWGGGSLDDFSIQQKASLWGDSVFLKGLARKSGLPHRPLPADWRTIIEAEPDLHTAIVWLGQASQALASGNIEAGMQTLEQLEREVFAPLLQLLNTRKGVQLNICDVPGHEVQISAKGVKRWWRKRQPIPDIPL